MVATVLGCFGMCAGAGLTGTVQDLAGKGIEGARVTAQLPAPGGATHETKSGEDGKWSLESLPDGKAVVTILSTASGVRIQDVMISGREIALPPVILQPSICGNGEFTPEFLRLKQAAAGDNKAEGAVLDGRSGDPLSDVQIDVTGHDGHAVLTVRTDASGKFRFSAKPGRYSVHVQKERYYDERGSIVLQQGYDVTLSRINLNKCGWFGFVCDPAKRPVCQ